MLGNGEIEVLTARAIECLRTLDVLTVRVGRLNITAVQCAEVETLRQAQIATMLGNDTQASFLRERVDQLHGQVIETGHDLKQSEAGTRIRVGRWAGL